MDQIKSQTNFQVLNHIHREVCSNQLRLKGENKLVSARESLAKIIQKHCQRLF